MKERRVERVAEKEIKWRIRKMVGREGWMEKNKGGKQEEVTTCAMLLHLASDGTLFLDWVEIGNVTPSGNDTYTFKYGPLESIDTVWNGKSVGRGKLEGE